MRSYYAVFKIEKQERWKKMNIIEVKNIGIIWIKFYIWIERLRFVVSQNKDKFGEVIKDNYCT